MLSLRLGPSSRRFEGGLGDKERSMISDFGVRKEDCVVLAERDNEPLLLLDAVSVEAAVEAVVAGLNLFCTGV